MATPVSLRPATALPAVVGGPLDRSSRPQKRHISVHRLATHINAQDAGTFIHPSLRPSLIPGRGRALCTSYSVTAGTVILTDAPYAVVPARCSGAEQGRQDVLVCSNLSCCRKVQRNGAIMCTQRCFEDVIWCDMTCKDADRSRHDYECAWLRYEGRVIRDKETPYDFATLWLVVRLLAGRHLELSSGLNKRDRYTWESTFQRGWQGVESCCGSPETWPDELQHWRRLIGEYFCNAALLPDLPSQTEILELLCKEESNGFGLYVGATGEFPLPQPPVTRGEAYGTALYTRAALTNHSCSPNVSQRNSCGFT